MNYWYVARPNELFLDIDNVSRSIRHAKARLQGAIECGKLDVAYIMQRQSRSKDHIHVIVTLTGPMMDGTRFAWEIILHGDIYRSACNIMRMMRQINCPDILISPLPCFVYVQSKFNDPIGEQSRIYDDKCECESKHNHATMESCPAAKRLRGENRAVGFFGKPSKNPCTIWPELQK